MTTTAIAVKTTTVTMSRPGVDADAEIIQQSLVLFKIKAKGQYWPLTCNTNHNTMFDMQEVSIKTNSNMHKPS